MPSLVATTSASARTTFVRTHLVRTNSIWYTLCGNTEHYLIVICICIRHSFTKKGVSRCLKHQTLKYEYEVAQRSNGNLTANINMLKKEKSIYIHCMHNIYPIYSDNKIKPISHRKYAQEVQSKKKLAPYSEGHL